MFFSKACQHAIRTLVYLSSETAEGPQPIKQVAAALEIPYPFLAKIIQDLTKRRLVGSRKGPGDGILLLRDASEISLLEIVEAIDGSGSLKQCVLGLPECGEDSPCPLHNVWTQLRDKMIDMLDTESLSKLAEIRN